MKERVHVVGKHSPSEYFFINAKLTLGVLSNFLVLFWVSSGNSALCWDPAVPATRSRMEHCYFPSTLICFTWRPTPLS